MRLSDFDFLLPEELIAQTPSAEREGSRLLVFDRRSGAVQHRQFRELISLLRAGDLLVFNDAKVIPARLLGKKRGSGGKVELLLTRPDASVRAAEALAGAAGALTWICLGQASKGLKPQTILDFDEGLSAEVVEARGGGEYLVRFSSETAESLLAALERAGRLPLPPYISRAPDAQDAERYQTVLARSPGSAAAPTAALHFSEASLAGLKAAGVRTTTLTLDVGPGTFLPVREDDVSKHRMHEERYVIPVGTAKLIADTRERGGRVVAVGTTVVRTLESATGDDGRLTEGPGATAIFITPGYRFRQVDALLTNFHLPKSTLVMLVAAFAGQDATLRAYAEAVAERYRFFSYGDAMFIADSPAHFPGGSP